VTRFFCVEENIAKYDGNLIDVWFGLKIWELDTSLFLRTVASPETLSGQNQSMNPGLEH
jgi:hypothetical protein